MPDDFDPAHPHITHRDGTVFQILAYEDRPVFENQPAFADAPIYKRKPIWGLERTYFASGKLKSEKRVIVSYQDVQTGTRRVEAGVRSVQTGTERVCIGWDEAATAAAYHAHEAASEPPARPAGLLGFLRRTPTA